MKPRHRALEPLVPGPTWRDSLGEGVVVVLIELRCVPSRRHAGVHGGHDLLMTVLICPSRDTPPIARTARRAAREPGPPDTARWSVEADGAPVCRMDLAIHLGNRRRGQYRIFEPTIDAAAGFLSHRFLSDGTFERGSQWWNPEILQDVLRALVRRCVSPVAVVTVGGDQPGTRDDFERAV